MSSSAAWPFGSRTRWGGSGGRLDRRPEGRAPDPARGLVPGAGSVAVLVLQMAGRGPGPRAERRDRLKAEVARLFGVHEGKYGSPEDHCGPARGRVAGEPEHRRGADERTGPGGPAQEEAQGTTRPGKGRWRAPDLVRRDFPARQLNRKWFGDGTQIATDEGRLHLVSVLDVASRRVLGFTLGERHDAQLAYGALAMALAVRGGQAPGVIFHTDQGSEPRFKGSSQHCLAGPSIGTGRGPLPGSSSRGSCGGGC